MDLDNLTKQHTRTMLLLNRAEIMESDFYLATSYNPVKQDELTAVVDELIATASSLTAQIHDLKHTPGEDEDEEEEFDPSMEHADQITEQHFMEYEPEQRIDLDEGVIHTTVKKVHIPMFKGFEGWTIKIPGQEDAILE